MSLCNHFHFVSLSLFITSTLYHFHLLSLSLCITFIFSHFLQLPSQVHQPSHRPPPSRPTSTSTRPSSSTPSLPQPTPTWALEQVHLVWFTLDVSVWFDWYSHQNSGRCNIFWLSGATSFGVDRAKQPRFSPYPHPVPPPSQVGQTEGNTEFRTSHNDSNFLPVY